MESKIPKLSGCKKPPAGLFDFKAVNDNSESEEQELKKPLAEINNRALASFKFTSNRRAKSPDFVRTQPVQPKLRRSRSAMEMRSEPLKGGVKRFQPTLDTIPNKRLKPAGFSQPLKPLKPLPIKTQEKKTAIMNTLKSSSSSNVLTLANKKPPLTKSISSGPTASKFKTTAAKPPIAAAKAPVSAASKNIAKPRPAPYDFKAKHALLLEKFNILKAKNEEQKEQLSTLEEQNEAADFKEQELVSKLETVEQELFDANEANEKLIQEIKELKQTNGNLQTKNMALANSLAATSEELCELKIRHEKLEKTAEEHELLKEKASTMETEIAEASSKLLMSQDQLYTINYERMVLHNMVLDLRGNIRVFARVRPPISNESDKAVCGWSFVDETSLEMISNDPLPTTGGRKQQKYDFAFDHVFDPNTTQEEIFELVSPLIQSALDGYNVCIFAYGQTGSGKTFTMDGASGKLGIIPRTVKLLFDSVATADILGWSYSITASFLEIYNELLYDLLSNEEKDIEIRMANAKSKTEIYVSNITQKEVTSAAQLYELMRVARGNRATASTAGNERSSRSHAVTRLEIVGKHASRPESLVGFINLVDLAGSESPKTSKRMEETKNINRSLSELSNVILALVQKNEHIPYRNSKLTHLLMPSLGGNSKTLMFVNVSPFQEHFGESVKSLRFASQVNSCKMAKAKRNRQLNVSNIV